MNKKNLLNCKVSSFEVVSVVLFSALTLGGGMALAQTGGGNAGPLESPLPPPQNPAMTANAHTSPLTRHYAEELDAIHALDYERELHPLDRQHGTHPH